ncbi:MAG TPA: NRDE family protein [Opitutaceae bacterium]
MCTVTWTHTGGAYSLFFNRDEFRARSHEHPPRRWNSRGSTVLAPLDDGGGGTWIAVNEHGLTAALLNHYARASKSPDNLHSRGCIPLLAAAHRSVADAVAWATAATMTSFMPFHLVLVGATGRSALVTWDGSRVTVSNDVRLPVTSSSFCPEEVARVREAQFRELVPDAAAVTAGALEAFHRSTNPKGGAWSVWMERPDACTRSLIRIDVDGSCATMRNEVAHPGYALLDSRADSPLIATLARAGVAAAGNGTGRGE